MPLCSSIPHLWQDSNKKLKYKFQQQCLWALALVGLRCGSVGPALYINITFTWSIRITHLATERGSIFARTCYAATTKLVPSLPRCLIFSSHFFVCALYFSIFFRCSHVLCASANFATYMQQTRQKIKRNMNREWRKSDDAAAVG